MNFAKNNQPAQAKNNPQIKILLDIFKQRQIDVALPLNAQYKQLIELGYLEESRINDLKQIEFKYEKNPLQHVEKLIFEYTKDCNFNCLHCRNGYTKSESIIKIDELKKVVEVFENLGIKRYDFIGGEVTKLGYKWLELTRYINRNNDKIVTVYTNGWWTKKQNFEAAGKFYKNTDEYLTDLKQNGVTHILFSIDGNENIHDKNRQQPGLFERILQSITQVKNIGIYPRITGVTFERFDEKFVKTYTKIADKIYDLPPDTDIGTKINTLLHDATNHFSNFIDIGNGVKMKKNKHHIKNISLKHLHCKAFYRPYPGIRITDNGNLSVCPLLDAGKGYGNIYENDIIKLLNNFQQSLPYQLHANKEIKNYLKYYRTDIFGEYYDHICSVRTILTLIAKKLQNKTEITEEIIMQINKEIVQYSGHKQV